MPPKTAGSLLPGVFSHCPPFVAEQGAGCGQPSFEQDSQCLSLSLPPLTVPPPCSWSLPHSL